MGNIDKVIKIFEVMQEQTEDNALASAMLTLCVIAEEFRNELDHTLCAGIRHGLFGEKAKSNDSTLGPDLKEKE